MFAVLLHSVLFTKLFLVNRILQRKLNVCVRFRSIYVQGTHAMIAFSFLIDCVNVRIESAFEYEELNCNGDIEMNYGPSKIW